MNPKTAAKIKRIGEEAIKDIARLWKDQRKDQPAVSAPMPPLLQAGLSSMGLTFRPWKLNPIVNEHYLDFKMGTMVGLIGMDMRHGHLVVLALINEEPGNGDFTKLMTALEAACLPLEIKIRVAQIWNERLQRHLIKKRNYHACFEADGEASVIWPHP